MSRRGKFPKPYRAVPLCGFFVALIRGEKLSIATLKADLTKTRAAIDQILANGEEFSSPGAFSTKSPKLEVLEKREAAIRAKIFRLQGYRRNNLPDFS